MTKIITYYRKCYKVIERKLSLVISYIIKLIMLATSFVTPYLFSSIIGFFADGSKELVYRNIVFISVMYLLMMLCQSAVFFIELHIEKDTRVSIKKNLLKHLLDLHPSNPALANTAKITETVYSDTNNVTTVAFSVFSVVNDILTVLISGLIIFSISPVLSLSMILVLCVTLFSSNKFVPTLATMNINLRRSTDHNFKLARDTIINLRPIKITNAMQYFSLTFGEDLDRVKEETIKRDKMSWYANIIGSGMENVGMIAFLIIGSYLVFGGYMSLPLFIMFSSYSGLFNGAITRLFKLNANMQQLIVSIQRVFELYELQDVTYKTENQIDITEMHLSNVSFSYEDKPVLNNFSHQFCKGACYVIIGHNGSGKTTLLNLLAGVLAPINGTISYDEYDSKDVSYKNIQRCLSYFNQDDKVYDISILDNLLLFEKGEETPFEKVIAVCTDLSIIGDIKNLPEGFETTFSETNSMSYGQKRKILLARTFLKPSKVVLLDEPLAGIDVESQRDILNAIKTVSKSKLLIIATHRADLFDFADEIIRM